MLRAAAVRFGTRRLSIDAKQSIHDTRLKARAAVTTEQRAALREARKERAAQVLQKEGASAEAGTGTNASGKVSSPTGSLSGSSIKLMWYGGFAVPTCLLVWGIYDESSPPAMFSKMIGLTGVISGAAESFTKPISHKLLPDWSQMPNVPQDIPVPHTLVLDLEDTLVNSSWDRKYGWRHAKRPGVDKFLTTMAQYYEIVLYSPSIDGIAQPVVANLDKHGCIMHTLYRESTYFKNGKHMKDLKSMNRPLSRMIVLDDDPDAYDGDDIDNVILVKPYSDPTDREDNTLARITPLLLEIAKENYNDTPRMLRQFRGMDADEIAAEHQRRIDALTEHREVEASRGLGAFAVSAKRNRPAPELTPMPEGADASLATPSVTAKDIVGAAPPADGIVDAGDGVIGWYKRRQKEQEEDQMRKMEKWSEHFQLKQKEKMEKENATA